MNKHNLKLLSLLTLSFACLSLQGQYSEAQAKELLRQSKKLLAQHDPIKSVLPPKLSAAFKYFLAEEKAKTALEGVKGYLREFLEDPEHKALKESYEHATPMEEYIKNQIEHAKDALDEAFKARLAYMEASGHAEL